jgi:AcrR family transcriptional regulator
MVNQPVSLRDRKRARTRAALLDAAADLFERKGFEHTTVAEIAAAAEIGTRTFFGHFASKEDLLFPDGESRVRAAVGAIENRGPADGPVDVLLRAVRHITETDADMVSRMATVRTRLFATEPAVRGRALQVQFAAQREIAASLHAAFPGELDEVTAAALTGALVGAISSALLTLLDDPDVQADPARIRALIERATQVALAHWHS